MKFRVKILKEYLLMSIIYDMETETELRITNALNR